MFDETHNILYMKVTVKDTPKDLILEGGDPRIKGKQNNIFLLKSNIILIT